MATMTAAVGGLWGEAPKTNLPLSANRDDLRLNAACVKKKPPLFAPIPHASHLKTL